MQEEMPMTSVRWTDKNTNKRKQAEDQDGRRTGHYYRHNTAFLTKKLLSQLCPKIVRLRDFAICSLFMSIF